ncbi:MAG: hypothetical protein BMS9Abin08_0296 [Gammaproteobacteria bacterium]|nr:MAG: hypothetical protein BMS9Abin08_0296 [Gammaproteobacteria bacterium]
MHKQHALHTLVGSVRNRLWLQETSRLLYLGIWGATAALLLFGLLHFLVQALSPKLFIAIALIPPVVTTAVSLLLRRPSAATAALAADRWFDSKQLITSAWELQEAGRSASGSGAMLVTQRAETCAARLQPGVHAVHPVTMPHSPHLPIALGLIGLFLLLMPGAQSNDDRQQANKGIQPQADSGLPDTRVAALEYRRDSSILSEESRQSAQGNAGSDVDHVSQDRAPARETRPGAVTQAVEHKGAARQNMSADEARPSPAAAGADASRAGPATSPDSEYAFSKGGRTPGGEPAHRRPGTDREDLPDMNFQLQPVLRAAANREAPAASGDTGIELSPNNKPAVDKPAPALSMQPAERVSVPYRAGFTPALRQYVSRYFSETETQP